MSNTPLKETETVEQNTRANWFPVVLRGIVASILAPASVLKFVDHSGEAAAFATYGIPMPELTVILVGAIQLPAAVMIAAGFAGRLAATMLVPVMVTAMLTGGVVATNVIVLVGCLGIVVFGTGTYAVWQPEREIVRRAVIGQGLR